MARLSPFYEKRVPSKQTSLDIFKGSWKSAFPKGTDLIAGGEQLFEDKRPDWVNSKLPGGIQGKTVLELGPFEGYQTYLLDKLGSSSILSVEGNSFNYLKCLLAREALGFSADYLLGDFISYLENTEKSFDLCWASGILYHQTKPLRLLELICQKSNAVYLWTHYFDHEFIKMADRMQQAQFMREGNIMDGVEDYQCMHYMRSYYIQEYNKNIPSYWEGGNQGFAYWLTYEDIHTYLVSHGFASVELEPFSTILGLPYVSLLAWKDK